MQRLTTAMPESGPRADEWRRLAVMGTTTAERLTVRGIELEAVRRGAGRPMLLLHGFEPVPADAPVLDQLGRHGEVLAPSHPGFGRSARPENFDTVYDLVHLYLDVLEQQRPDRVVLLGLGFGGWLAAEIASTCGDRLAALVLIDALGIKVSDRETRDILDVFNTSPGEVHRRRWHDPARWAPDFDAMSDDELIVSARNRDALCLYGWHPCLYNPQLRPWLSRISVPTLVLWGASDGIVSPAYGRAYADSIPGASFELIDGAAHHPELERPDAVVDRIVAFLGR
jgi:pimeloyl-ACP methyl ester carboxylesterase